MEVFVIPVGADRYELYSETAVDGEPDAETPVPARGVFGRLRHRFGVMLRAAEERAHARPEERQEAEGWLARAQERMLGWVVERIVEQRLLWNLRRQTEAVAAHPQDMTFEQAMGVIRRELQRDFERHRIWVVVYTVALVASAPLALVPGPNVLAYYLAFRVVGHFFSMRGAASGLHRVEWRGRVCPPLSELREAVVMEPHARHDRVRDIGAQLRLQNLPRFFERVAVRHA
jgi:hypothetical protein